MECHQRSEAYFFTLVAEVGSTSRTWHSRDLREAWDDLTGKEVNPSEVMGARLSEIERVEGKKVRLMISRSNACKEGLKIIGTTWIDIGMQHQGDG